MGVEYIVLLCNWFEGCGQDYPGVFGVTPLDYNPIESISIYCLGIY